MERSRLAAEFKEEERRFIIRGKIEAEGAVMKANVFGDGATGPSGMDLVEAGVLGVLIGRSPGLEQIGPVRGGDEQLLQGFAFEVFEEDVGVLFLFGIVEARAGIEAPGRKFFPRTGNHTHANPGIESGEEIASRRGVDGNLHRSGVSGLHPDPDMVNPGGIAVLFDPGFQISADGMGEGKIPGHQVSGSRNIPARKGSCRVDVDR